ncbi:hypothetical protein Tco_1312556 [Tanacetum coccineum]
MEESSSQIPQQQKQIQQQDQQERSASPIPFAPVNQVGFNLKYVFFNPNNEISLWYLKLPKPPPKMRRRITKAKSLELKLDPAKSKLDPTAGGPTSLGVTSEEGAHPQLGSGVSTSNINKLIFLASFIIHVASTSGRDALVDSTDEAGPGKSAPNDYIPQQQGMDEGTQNNSFDQLSAGTGLNVLTDKTQSEARLRGDKFTSSDEILIKLEDLSKLVQNVKADFMDLDFPEDDPIIMVDESEEDEEEKDEEVHATSNVETKDTSAPKPPSPRSIQVQELTNQVLILQSQKHKLKNEKRQAEAEVALLSTKPSFPNVEQLNELLVKSLHTKFLKILSAHDFSSSLPTELKDLPSKFNDLTKEVKGLKKHVHELEIKLLGDLKEIPIKVEDFTTTMSNLTTQVAELKTLHLLNKVTEALNQFAQAIASASKKTKDANVPLADQAGTKLAKGRIT